MEADGLPVTDINVVTEYSGAIDTISEPPGTPGDVRPQTST